MIKLKSIEKCFDNTTILNSIDLDIKKGEFVTIIGRSGCGKTTLLKLINGLLKPDRGTVCINGENIADKDIYLLRRSIGYVIQNRGLFPHMSVSKNITYVPSISGRKNKNQNRDLAQEMIDLVGLDAEMLSRYPDELSGGQQQRVGIARALAASPQILLMDEPFSALDEITRKTMQDMLLNLWEKLHLTIVFVTHDIDEAMKLGNRVVVMDAGGIVQIGTPEAVKNHPADLIVSQLVNH